MNWVVYAIATWFCLGLEWGMRSALQLGGTPVAPSFVMIFAVYVALWAPTSSAHWSALILGLFLDLLHQTPTTAGHEAVVIGPNAIAVLIAVHFVTRMRGVLFRRGILALATLTAVASVIAALIACILLAIRASSIYADPLQFSAASQFFTRSLSGLFSATLAVPFGALLILLRTVFGFDTGPLRPAFGNR